MNNHLFRAFTERSFLFLWISEVFTQVAGNLFNFYLILVVFTLTKTNTAVAGVIISFTLPAILFGIVAGVLVDRWNKRTVLVLSNIIRALCFIILAFFHTDLVIIYTISIIVSIAAQFIIPAETPIIPLLVKPQMLFSANALFGLALYGSILIAYIISGPLLLTLHEVGTLIFLALLMLAGAFFIFLIPIEKGKSREVDSETNIDLTIRGEVRRAIALLAKTREITSALFLLALLQILILVIASVAPGYASQVLHMRIEEFPLVFVAPAAIGMIVGAIILVHWFHSYPRNRLVIAGLFLSGMAMSVLPYGSLFVSKAFVQTMNISIPRSFAITNIHLLILLAFILGFANALVFVPSNTILLEKTSDESRGKIFGVLNTVVGIFSLLPLIIVGGLSDIFGVGHVITGIGATLILLGVLKIIL